jgi:hypothetical protein
MNEMDLDRRLDRIEGLLFSLVGRPPGKDWYSTDEFACLVGKAEFTVREWCRRGRISARKQQSGRGLHFSWVVAHEELLRYQRDGLLPKR